MLLAIDPGVTTGWALFHAGLLIECGTAPANCVPSAGDVTEVVIERPRIYPGGRTKNPNDVLSVAVNAGEWAGRYSALGVFQIRYVLPSEWKGQTPKEVQHARDWARLTEREQAIVNAAGKGVAPSKRHNMLDAVGIGLWAIGRRK